MATFEVRTFELEGNRSCLSRSELLAHLRFLSEKVFEFPTLVNVYSGERIACIGVGCELTTLQLVDRVGHQTHRAVTGDDGSDDTEFVYQGEATFVRSRHLVPRNAADAAAVEWLDGGELSQDLQWSSGPFPPTCDSGKR
ncbi:MAG TPA: Imm1 family immunity protein [Tepidisphaeraceae bacterium]|nr:Imm1 family immunity protein [Tepidisphaeraceae bacterium]